MRVHGCASEMPLTRIYILFSVNSVEASEKGRRAYYIQRFNSKPASAYLTRVIAALSESKQYNRNTNIHIIQYLVYHRHLKSHLANIHVL